MNKVKKLLERAEQLAGLSEGDEVVYERDLSMLDEAVELHDEMTSLLKETLVLFGPDAIDDDFTTYRRRHFWRRLVRVTEEL
jgi:hypothetical protein